MILKRLIVQGFKSFPDKTEIKFASGLTSIVGPNGSGKSNISDAILWVLGEQSTKNLRGSKMEDVIFSGTSKRAAVGFAMVSLILDNQDGKLKSDFLEVMVSRKYYRSGESVYSLNGKTCRLKDIHELFMDTGLGRDGYSIIGQGRIDEILSVKSEQRRDVFEEAAGITKFRYKKEEAQKKLLATDENLSRVYDIYTELEKQKIPLEEQAIKAKKYLQLYENVRKIEISIWLMRLSQINKLVTDGKQNTDVLIKQIQDLKNAQIKFDTKREQHISSSMKIDLQIEDFRKKLREIEVSISEKSSEIAVSKANLLNGEQNADRTAKEKQKQLYQKEKIIAQIKEQEEKRREIEQEYSKILDESKILRVQNAEAEKSLFSIYETTRKIDKQLEDKNRQRFDILINQNSAKTSISTVTERKSQVKLQIDSLNAQISKEQKHFSLQQNQYEHAKQEVELAKSNCEIIQNQVDKNATLLENSEHSLRTLQSEYKDCFNRVNMLTEMQKEYDGFSKSIKTVMKHSQKNSINGVFGPVSSLIQVDSKYAIALDTALAGSGSNIIVSDYNVGKDLIEYLKKHDAGRATFLPIDTIRSSVLNEQNLEKQQGFCGIASDLVQTKGIFKNIVSSILGRTVIADNIENAIKISRNYKNRFRVVTLDGQIMQSGGAMTGGSSAKNSGIIARSSTLAQLTQKLTQLEDMKEQAQNDRDTIAEKFEQLKLSLIEEQQEQKNANDNFIEINIKYEKILFNINHFKQQVDNLNQEADKILGSIANFEKIVQETHGEIQKIDDEILILNTEREKSSDIINKSNDQRQQERDLLAKLDAKIAQNRALESGISQSLEEKKQNLQDIDKDIIDFELQIENISKEQTKIEKQIQTLEQTKIVLNASENEIKQYIDIAIKEKMQVEKEKNDIDKENREVSEKILKVERENVKLESQITQAESEKEQLINSMWEAYELTPTTSTQYEIVLNDVANAKKELLAQKSQIRALGSVNVSAPEEYNSLLERYNFLKEQKEDLDKAKTEIVKLIDHLTLKMKEVFASEFAKLNICFGKTFKEMFGGGHAELYLEDTSDILNCGIEIRVSPPGKAVKRLTLLSGGERAFVAIALYFAILIIRPTPFCVLDEIEAALDDSNVIKFAKYIHKLADKTQFIAITHRRGTMENSDMLYGVTMQEQGVSKLLVLNVNEAEQSIGKSEELNG